MIKLLRFSLTILAANLHLLKTPYKLNLHLTNRCLSRCRICRIWKKPRSREITPAQIRKFLHENPHFQWIDLIGGDIFLRKDLQQILSIIAEECLDLYVLHFTTSGQLTKKIMADTRYLCSVFRGRILISISIDGPQKLHDKLRGLKGSWSQAVTTYQQLSQLKGLDVSLGFTSSRYNAGLLQKTFEELKKELPSLKLEKIYYNPSNNSHFYKNTDVAISGRKDRAIADIDYYLRNTPRLGFPTLFFKREFMRTLRTYLTSGKYPFRRCAALSSSLLLSPNGDIHPCLFFGVTLGSLNKGDYSIRKVLSRPSAARLKPDILRFCPVCLSSCEAYHTLMAELLGIR
jgi:MoaA/NifB/PqqE/SkfB family radical SAM enzyme